eukprot:2439005-Pyramimonas_sp.AAC.1
MHVSRQKKTRRLEACVFSKLLYGLVSCLPLSRDLDRLDGFQARRLRRIDKIPPAFVSRVSNVQVRATAQAQQLSIVRLQQQFKYYGKLARSPSTAFPKAM